MVRIHEEKLTKTADCSWVERVNSVTIPKLFPPPWLSYQKFVIQEYRQLQEHTDFNSIQKHRVIILCGTLNDAIRQDNFDTQEIVDP